MKAAELAAIMMLTAGSEPMVRTIRDPYSDMGYTSIRPSRNRMPKPKPKSKTVLKRRAKNKAARKARKK